MTLLSWLRSLFAPRPTGLPATRVSAEMPRVKARALDPCPGSKDQPSCFARGVARSLKQEAIQWVWEETYAPHWRAMKHSSGSRLLYRWMVIAGIGHDPLCRGCGWLREVSVDGRDLSEADQRHIALALEANPPAALKAVMDEAAAKTEAARRVESHFTKLGCPSDSA